MRALVQRVSRAAVRVDGADGRARSAPGLLVLLGVTHDDDEAICDRLADKVRALRIFPDAEGRMNEPLGRPRGARASASSRSTATRARATGRRYVAAARARASPSRSTSASATGSGAQGGVFGAHMEVELVNDGPVTLLLELP